jgi:preprotein translocase subunit YajC
MSQYGLVIYFVVIAAVFYFLIIRPQQTRQKEQNALMSSLVPGDKVITAGGVYGTIRGVEEDAVDVEVAEGVVIKVAKPAVARKLEA